jgi:hypothetical protein
VIRNSVIKNLLLGNFVPVSSGGNRTEQLLILSFLLSLKPKSEETAQENGKPIL